VFWIGLFPNPLLKVMHTSVDHLIEQEDQEDRALARRDAREMRERREARDGHVAQVSLKANNK